jgi:para-nitrobenzyl esterase
MLVGAAQRMQSQVRIEQGVLRGFGESGIHKFFGVPYATAPVGRLRWRPPLAPAGWDGVREARRFGPACVQTVGAAFDLRVAEQSEDCPYLNVWTRTLDPDARQPVPTVFNPRIRRSSVWPSGSAMLSVRMPKASRQC